MLTLGESTKIFTIVVFLSLEIIDPYAKGSFSINSSLRRMAFSSKVMAFSIKGSTLKSSFTELT